MPFQQLYKNLPFEYNNRNIKRDDEGVLMVYGTSEQGMVKARRPLHNETITSERSAEPVLGWFANHPQVTQ